MKYGLFVSIASHVRRNTTKPLLKKTALAFIVLSFILCAFIVAADVGIWNTPYETTDTAGRTMGFNDPLSMEHCRIILSNFRIRKFCELNYAYSWLLLAMHGWGAWLLLKMDLSRPLIRWFFALQGLIFPLGWLGFLAIAAMARSVLQGTFDRESMVDLPFIALTAHPIWIMAAIAISFAGWIASHLPPHPQTESGT